MRRSRLKSRKDKKIFRQTAKPHPGNTVSSVMRGGIRK